MGKVIELILMAVATWRVSSMLVDEAGPADVFIKLRAKIGVSYDAFSQRVGTNLFSSLFLCVWCMSVWVGTGFYLLFRLHRGLYEIITYPLVISGLAIYLHKRIAN
jgi:hypothetical protein